MAKVNRSGLMVLVTSVNGERIGLMVEASSYMLMAMFMMGSGLMIRLTGTESTCMSTVLSMKENGKMIYSMAKVLRPGQMVLATTESTPSEESMALDLTNGTTVLNTQANGMKTKSMESVSIPGLTADATKENGKIIIWKD